MDLVSIETEEENIMVEAVIKKEQDQEKVLQVSKKFPKGLIWIKALKIEIS